MEKQLSSFAMKSYELFMNGIYEAVDICGRGVDKDEDRPHLFGGWRRFVVDFLVELFPFDFIC